MRSEPQGVPFEGEWNKSNVKEVASGKCGFTTLRKLQY
ncbi:hypothetical protein BTJ44_05313 [Bacillus mycoides]|nr:hypothetical protein BTJ44_05313 [Bacillus mycoides]